MKIISITRCDCGAITVETESGDSYSVLDENFEKFFPSAGVPRDASGALAFDCDAYPTMYCCNHCVNHYGLDLCACGSGEAPNDCENGYAECGRPMQMLGGYTRVVARDALH